VNIYNLHTNPEQLLFFNKDKTQIPYFAVERAIRLKRKRDKSYKQYEDTIAKDGIASLKYAWNGLRGRFPKGEPAILTLGVPEALRYFGAWFEFEVHWPELAEMILQNGTPKQARKYAENLTVKWPEGEELIKQDRIEWKLYQQTWVR